MRGLIKALQQARAPVPYIATGNSRISFASKARADDKAAMLAQMGAVGTLFSIVNRTSVSTAAANWHLYRSRDLATTDITVEEARDELTSHAALDLWNKPNPFMPQQMFVETFQQHVDLVGEGFWVVGHNPLVRSLPLEMWPVRPDTMEPVPHPTKFLTGWIYTGPDGEKTPFDVGEVIHLKMPNPVDIYRGMGPVQALLADLDATRYTAQWNRNFFENSAEPGGIIEVDKRLGDDEFRELTRRWNEQHKGVAKAHRVAVIEHGNWVARAFSQRDMQFAELRTVARDTIMEGFGMSKHMLGITEDVNRSNAEAGEAMFQRNLITPRLERIKQALNSQLLPMFGEAGAGLEFDFDGVVPDDDEAMEKSRLSKAQAIKLLVDTGFDPEQVLQACGFPPIDYVAPAWMTGTTPGPTPSGPNQLPPGPGEDDNPSPEAPRARLNGKVLVP